MVFLQRICFLCSIIIASDPSDINTRLITNHALYTAKLLHLLCHTLCALIFYVFLLCLSCNYLSKRYLHPLHSHTKYIIKYCKIYSYEHTCTTYHHTNNHGILTITPVYVYMPCLTNYTFNILSSVFI